MDNIQPEKTPESEDATTTGSKLPNLDLIKPEPVVLPGGEPIAGFPVEYIPAGEQGRVEVCGFHTFDEGLSFYKMLEAFTGYVKQAGGMPSRVSDMLVVLSPDVTHVYMNNSLPIKSRVRVRRSLEAGEMVFRDDIAGVDRLEFPNIEPPEHSGFMLLVSSGWRKGMCFDFRPLNPNGDVSTAEAYTNIKAMGGMVLSHLLFTEKFLLSSEDWDAILAAKWFPFMFLSEKLWEQLFQAVLHGGDTCAPEQRIHEAFLQACDQRLHSWRQNEHFANHIEFLEAAVDAYKRGDWLTVVSVAFPRVEGLLRQAFGGGNSFRRKFSEALDRTEGPKSLLFPERLRQYFEDVLYPSIHFDQPDLPPTRHTVTHGVVSAQELTQKVALTLLLLIDHVLYCMPNEDDDG